MRTITIAALALVAGCKPADTTETPDPGMAWPTPDASMPPDPPPERPPGPPARPLYGGTLLATRDRQIVVAADPDRDVIWTTAAVTYGTAVHPIDLRAGDQPFRLIED